MKSKKCTVCKKEYIPRASNQKTCSFDCFKSIKSLHDKKYREKNAEKLREKKKEYYSNGPKKKVCPNCKKEHRKRKNNFCSKKCYLEKMGSLRVGSSNPNWKNAKHTKTYNKQYFDWVYKNKGLLPEELGCEMCGANATVILDRHHIIFKSEAGWHKEINNPRNIVQCCRSCHLMFHSKSLSRDSLIKERGLQNLFPELNLL